MIFSLKKPIVQSLPEPQATDAEWVQAIKKDKRVFTVLYNRYVSAVHKFVYGRVGNRQDAEDITAQIFLEALEKIDNYQEKGSFSGWLFTIARRRVIDSYRRTNPVDALDAHPTLRSRDDVSHSVAQRMEAERMQACIRHLLSGEQQEIIDLRFSADLTYREIAEIVGKGESAVKMSVKRSLAKIEAYWEASHE